MTPALPPMLPQPAAAQSRDTAGALGVDAQRPLRAARAAETARAVRPVDAVGVPADPRLTTRRDQPVGPPPAFSITLLQHLRATAFDPLQPAAEPAADPDPEDAESAERKRPGAPSDESARRGRQHDRDIYADAGTDLAPETPGRTRIDLKL